jgi:2-iminobutanoate/2-iminopropanoate deaminase
MTGRKLGTLFISGTTDGGAAIIGTTSDAAKRVMDNIKRAVEAGGLTMDHLIWVQVFSSNLADYQVFNEVYPDLFQGLAARPRPSWRRSPAGRGAARGDGDRGRQGEV